MMNPRWNERSAEDQSLFNPAFCGLLLRTACKGYTSETLQPAAMPLPLAFLVLPVVLSQRMRDTLPTMKTRITTWAASNPEHIAGFGDRARLMADVSREAIQFGCAQQWLVVSAPGLAVGPAKFRPDPPKLATDTDDIGACYVAARFLGRWLAKGGSPATIMSLLGVAP